MFLQFLNCPRVASVNATDRLEAKRFFHAFASPQVHSAHHYRRRSHPGWRRFCLQQRRRQEERRRRPGHMELSKAGQILEIPFQPIQAADWITRTEQLSNLIDLDVSFICTLRIQLLAQLPSDAAIFIRRSIWTTLGDASCQGLAVLLQRHLDGLAVVAFCRRRCQRCFHPALHMLMQVRRDALRACA